MDAISSSVAMDAGDYGFGNAPNSRTAASDVR
jgi:hypothetical protein